MKRTAFVAALLPCAALAASPLLLPCGSVELPDGSAEAARKEFASVGKSLAEDFSTSVWIVQYNPEKTMASAIRRLVMRAGARLLSPVPGGAYLVRATKAQTFAILESGQVAAARLYAPGDKGAPPPVSKGFAEGDGTDAIYILSAFSDADPAALRGKVSRLGGCEVLDGADGYLRVRMNPDGYARAVALPEVKAVGPWIEPTFDNDVAVKAMHVDSIWPSRQGPASSTAADAAAQAPATARRVAEDLFTKGLLTPSGEYASAPEADRESVPSAATSVQTESAVSSSLSTLGLTGKGQIVAVCDSGLDTGNLATLHPDVRGRVVKAFDYARPGDWSDLSGHGTHVIGSVLGNGAASGRRIRGVAYEAELAIQSCGPDSGRSIDVPPTCLEDAYLFRTSDGRSPRIHSNSWGKNSKGAYDEDSRHFDSVAFHYPDYLLVKSAGNAGEDKKQPLGVVDPGSIGAPGTAKNCITVGNAENHRSSGGKAGTPYANWGEILPDGSFVTDFPHDPIASDFLTQGPKGSETLRGMAASSSRGPCADGRVKPDVVAPGQQVLSLYSSASARPDKYGAFDDSYCYKNGTSMSTPLVAGTAALVRQWLVERRNVADPDAATIKALLCAGAKSLAPGQYGTGKFREIPAAWESTNPNEGKYDGADPIQYPNNVEGWGMVDLENTVANSDGVAFVDGEIIGEKETKTFKVFAPGGRPLVILMAYGDFPGMDNEGGLVNDLDMTVADPSGKNIFPNSKSVPDDKNNVEGVRWKKAPKGMYTVKVFARTLGRPYGEDENGRKIPAELQWTNGREKAVRFSLVANGAKEIREVK